MEHAADLHLRGFGRLLIHISGDEKAIERDIGQPVDVTGQSRPHCRGLPGLLGFAADQLIEADRHRLPEVH
jgi:hypothetical protein